MNISIDLAGRRFVELDEDGEEKIDRQAGTTAVSGLSDLKQGLAAGLDCDGAEPLGTGGGAFSNHTLTGRGREIMEALSAKPKAKKLSGASETSTAGLDLLGKALAPWRAASEHGTDASGRRGTRVQHESDDADAVQS